MRDKTLELAELMKAAANCSACSHIQFNADERLRNRSLINFIGDSNINGRVPNMWTDWLNRVDAKVMVVAQDWGAISGIHKYLELYNNRAVGLTEQAARQEWLTIVRTPDSASSKNLIRYLSESARLEDLDLPSNFTDHIFLTNAVLCARQGTISSGSENFAARVSTANCQKYLRRQIEVVSPIVILTLGEWPLKSICEIIGYNLSGNLTTQIKRVQAITPGYINVTYKDQPLAIVPAFHPAARPRNRSVHDQITDYRFLWRALSQRLGLFKEDLVAACFPSPK